MALHDQPPAPPGGPAGVTASPASEVAQDVETIDEPAATESSVAPPPGEAGRGAARSGRGRVAAIWLALFVVAALAGSALFVSGYTLGRQNALTAGTPDSLQAEFQPFWDAFNKIDQRYAGGPVDRHLLLEGALDGMFKALGDPYSSYMSAEDYAKSLAGVSGQFEGIGADMATKEASGTQGCSPLSSTCRIYVVRPIRGSPAERAGLLAGDVFLKVDGASVDGKTIDQVVALVRGKRGTQVTLTILRGSDPAFDVRITRDVINAEDVTSSVLAGGQIGYIRISGFGAGAADDFRSQLGDLVNARHLQRIVIDLRGNPGGFVDQARTIASQFIASGPIYWEQPAGEPPVEQDAEPGGIATDPAIRVAVLIDANTASASEILAGALQDTGRAQLVGTKSFGKGTVQEWDTLGANAGGFRLTIAKWLTPKQRWIHHVGLTPDVPITAPANAPAGSDAVLERAISLLGAGSADLRVLQPAA
jgi:carboxyl-terminal processing protease